MQTNIKQTDRNLEIAEQYVTGGRDVTLQMLATKYGVTRERIRQIVRELYPHYIKPKVIRLTLEQKLERRKLRRITEFWAKTEKRGDCILWTRGIHPQGYGRATMHLFTKDSPAYRVAWILTKGDIPEGYWLRRTCENKLCINPDHYYLYRSP